MSVYSKWMSYEDLAKLYTNLCNKYPIVSIEDPFAEDDWEAWSYFFKSAKCQIVGDDLTVTNPIYIKKAIETKACNALLLKVNQIGTISEAIQASLDSFKANWGVMVSHRSGETEGWCSNMCPSRQPLTGFRCYHRGHCRWSSDWPDQDRCACSLGTIGETEPNPSYRRGAWIERDFCR